MNSLHSKSIVIALLLVSACTRDISFLGEGTTPGAPAPFGHGESSSKTSAEQRAFTIANKNVTLKTVGNTPVTIGREDGLLAGLKNHRKQARPAGTLVEATRNTLGFMSIQKDVALDKKTHYIETGWYNGYKATATIDKTNLHASSLNLKIVDRSGKEVSSSRRIAVEEAIFRQTKMINYGK